MGGLNISKKLLNMRVQKSLNKLLKDLDNHLFLLKTSVENYSTHSAFFISMANELRTLVCKGKDHEDILPVLIKLFNFDESPYFKNKISLTKFLHQKNIILNKKRYSNLEFIKILTTHSGEFIHIRKDTDYRFILGSQFVINGISILNRELLIVAKDILHIGGSFLEYIKNLSTEDKEKINNKYLKSIKK
ncbi:MAG: hypothetical protein L3J07_02270 [Candidatus Magasanikbacteria bacterium]|nr:hypothetical protein [Candidatus Magasanikbacteria bacterium]